MNMSFYSNNIETTGMKILADALKVNRTIAHLEVYMNPGNDSCFVPVLEDNYVITRLGGEFDPITDGILERNRKYRLMLEQHIADNILNEVVQLLNCKLDLWSISDNSSPLLKLGTIAGPQMLRFLLQEPLLRIQINRYPILHAACKAGKKEEAWILIRHGASFVQQHGSNFLSAAVESQNIDLIRLLVWLGADYLSQGQNALIMLDQCEPSAKQAMLDIITKRATREKALKVVGCAMKFGKDTPFQRVPREINRTILQFVDTVL